MSDETLEDFKNSFNYGTRADLAFKFLARLSPDDAGRFLQELLLRLGNTIDDGDAGRLIRLAYEWQVRAYAAENTPAYDDAPFTPMRRPAAQARLALLTSTGHFVEGDDPKPFAVEAMTQEEAMARIVDFLRAAPELSSIPVETPSEMLRVRHGGYDIRGALEDPNVGFPLQRLLELEREGVIGEVASPAHSFVGATSQGRVREAAPQWADMLKSERVEAALLVPA